MQTTMTSIFYLQESLSKLNRSFHQKRHVDHQLLLWITTDAKS